MTNRRVLGISGETFQDLFTVGHRFPAMIVTLGLPQDAHFVGINYDAVVDTFLTVWESDSFEPVEMGSILPRIEVVYEEIETES
jgi:hypothetical protein